MTWNKDQRKRMLQFPLPDDFADGRERLNLLCKILRRTVADMCGPDICITIEEFEKIIEKKLGLSMATIRNNLENGILTTKDIRELLAEPAIK